MEFSYKKSLVMTYVAFGSFAAFLILLSTFFMVLFAVPIIAVDIVIGILGFGAFKRAYQMSSITILLEREGIHYFRGKKKITFIPWHIVEDFTFTSSRCILRVGNEFYYISRELNNFEEFERQMVEQLTLPLEQRGSNLPKLDMPESMGGIRDDSPPPEKQTTLLQPEVYEYEEEEKDSVEILGEAGDDEDWINKRVQSSSGDRTDEIPEDFSISNEQLLGAEGFAGVGAEQPDSFEYRKGNRGAASGNRGVSSQPEPEDDDDIF
ncbi:MAG: hypothetical protein LWY06_02090 [Firmicutes bacterium]|nr:hypothetical protein [Bacillota bacterium]